MYVLAVLCTVKLNLELKKIFNYIFKNVLLSIIVEIVSRPSRGCQCKIVHGLFCASANRSARLLDTDSRQSIFQNRLHGVPPVGVHRSLCRHLLHGPLRVEKQFVIHLDTIILTLFTLLSFNFYKNQIV